MNLFIKNVLSIVLFMQAVCISYAQTDATRIQKTPENTTKEQVYPNSENGYPENPWRTDGSWDYVFDGLDLTNTLYKIENLDHVLIINSTFQDVTVTTEGDEYVLYIKNCQNVYVSNVSILNTDTKFTKSSAIRIERSDYVVVDHCRIDNHDASFDGPVHAHAINLAKPTSNITIQNNTISNEAGSGINTAGKSGDYDPVHDNPIPNCIIRNNIIYNTGLRPDLVGNSPTHGMYVKAQDVLVENNTVYNCYDGSCLSIRSTGIIRGNKCWNAKGSVFAYWPQKPGGDSELLLIENNVFFTTEILREGFSRPFAINKSYKHDLVPFDNFIVRFNTIYIAPNIAQKHNRVAAEIDVRFPNIHVYGNVIVDERARFNPIGRENVFSDPPTPALAYYGGNLLSDDTSLFADIENFDFRLKSDQSITLDGNPELPAIDIEGLPFNAGNIQPGAYQMIETYSIETYAPPMNVTLGQSYDIEIPYQVTDTVDIHIVLQNMDEAGQTEGKAFQTVDKSGITTFNVTVAPDAVPGGNYQWLTYITPVGQGWDERYDDEIHRGIEVQATITSLTAAQSSQGVNFYPNPANKELYLQNTFQEQIKLVSIHNLQGVLVKEVYPDLEEIADKVIDVADLPAGIHILNLKFESGKTQNYRLVIDK
ncbi:MAG: right-handed parallel beta-helix repeat-containing protein [Bacteroidota bacterium]